MNREPNSYKNYFQQPANIMELLKWLVPMMIFFVGWCIKIEINQVRSDYQINEIRQTLQEQNTTLKAINDNLNQADRDRIPRLERLTAIETKVDMLLDQKTERIKEK